jgi:hypothetical protein
MEARRRVRMPAPLEFKPRVRLPEVLAEERPARRRSTSVVLGGAIWLAVVTLAVGITEGVVPVERWLQRAVAGAGRPPAELRPVAPPVPVRARSPH